MLRFRSALLLLASAATLAGCGLAPQMPTAQSGAASALQVPDEKDLLPAVSPWDADRAEVAPKADLGTVEIEADSRFGLTPEKAAKKAFERARGWQPDAQLRFVGWGVVKFKLFSGVSHVFYSPKAQEVCVVSTMLSDRWQKAVVFDHKLVVKPLVAFEPLPEGGTPIDGSEALSLVRHHFIVAKRPITLMALFRPYKVPFAVWGGFGAMTPVLVLANTGQSISTHLIDPFPKEWGFKLAK